MSDTSRYVTRFTRTSAAGLVFLGLCILGLATVPIWGGTDDMRLLIDFFLYLSLASLWNFLAGYAGLVSVGQQAYVGLGGYLLYLLAIQMQVPPLAAVPLVGIAVAVVSIPIAGLLFRLRGAYFAIGSWVVAEVFRLGFQQMSSLGGGSGMSLPARIALSIGRRPYDRFLVIYGAALVLLLFIQALIVFVLRSRYGLALTAIRDNELAARSNGVDVGRTKLVVYVLTAFGTAMVGSLIFIQKLRISPDAGFSVNDWTALVIFMVVIGGVGSFEGPILGTILFFVLRETLADLGSIYLMILGAVAILVMLRAPKGLWGLIREKLPLELVPLQLRVLKPSGKREPRPLP